MGVDFLDRFFGDLSRGIHVTEKRCLPVRHCRGNAAERQDRSEAPHGVCTATEAKKEDAIAGLPHPQERGVAIDDVGRDPEPGCLADDIVQPAIRAGDKQHSTIRL